MRDRVFSATTKEELARIVPEDAACRRAELAGLLRAAGVLRLAGGGRAYLRVVTESGAVARKAYLLVKLVIGLQSGIAMRERRRLRRATVYEVEVPLAADPWPELQALGLADARRRVAPCVPRRIIARSACRRAFLRGVFLGAGWVGNPAGGYHWEVAVTDPALAEQLVRLLGEEGFRAGRTRRRGRPLVYLKDAETIASWLKLAGAHQAVLAYEDVRARREMKSRVNRMVNMDTANAGRVAAAALRQCEDARLVADHMRLERLPPELRAVARARLAHPDASLSELALLLRPPQGRSAVYHRLRRLAAIAGELRQTATQSHRNR